MKQKKRATTNEALMSTAAARQAVAPRSAAPEQHHLRVLWSQHTAPGSELNLCCEVTRVVTKLRWRSGRSGLRDVA
jgi:hypothetical protein